MFPTSQQEVQCQGIKGMYSFTDDQSSFFDLKAWTSSLFCFVFVFFCFVILSHTAGLWHIQKSVFKRKPERWPQTHCGSGQRRPALCPPQHPAGFFASFINSLCTCNYTRTPIWCACSFGVCSSKLHPSVPEAGSRVSGDPRPEIYGGVSWGQCRGREGRAAGGAAGEGGLRVPGTPQRTPRGGLKSSFRPPSPMHQQVLLALTSKTTFNFKRSFLKLIFIGV